MADDLELTIDDEVAGAPVDVVLDDAAVGAKAAADPAAPATPAAEPVAAEPEVDPGTASLREQLAAETRRREEAERLANERHADAQKAQTEVVDQQRQLITNSIEAAKEKGDQLERQLADLMSAGDHVAAAKIQRQMAKVEADLIQLDNAKASVEAQRAAPKLEPVEGRVRAPAPVNDPVEALAAQLSPTSASWLRQHPECATDTVLFQEMVAADARAQRQGIKPDTPEYFAFVEQRLGFSAPVVEQPRVAAQPAPARRAVPAAPVSRDVPSLTSGTGGRQTVKLSPEEQDFAASQGMTNQEYAKHKFDMLQEKARMN